MTENDLKELVTGCLDQPGGEVWSARSGAVLYSDVVSVRPGRFYLMGINPGGSETSDPAESIASNLAAPPGTNSYADQCWSCPTPYTCTHCENGVLRPQGRDMLQRRVCSLFDALQVQPRDVLSTNLVFARSSELSKLRGSKADWVRRCWKVHLHLLREVKPTWIITLGFGEAFSALRRLGTEASKQAPVSSDGDRLGWHRRLRLDLGGGDNHEVGVLGVAHPGNRGFNRAGCGRSQEYPDILKQFIEHHVLTGASA